MTAPIISGFPGEESVIQPSPEIVARYYFDARANRALRGTASGESMADWGERYVREARALVRMGESFGRLWTRTST